MWKLYWIERTVAVVPKLLKKDVETFWNADFSAVVLQKAPWRGRQQPDALIRAKGYRKMASIPFLGCYQKEIEKILVLNKELS